MRILFIHPDDHFQKGPWDSEKWDRVIDLGMGGNATYAAWSKFFGCEAKGMGFAQADSAPVRRALLYGEGLLLDSAGVDWWKVISICFAQRLYQIAALEKVLADLSDDDYVAISRSGFFSNAIESILGRPITRFTRGRANGAFDYIFKRARRLSYSQMKQIAWDKYDSRHRVRSRFAPTRPTCPRSTVLLPSAYLNVSRMALAYSKLLPERDFLLINARESGWCDSLPTNVVQGNLASFTAREASEAEHQRLTAAFARFLPELSGNSLIKVLAQSGELEQFSADLRRWLAVRDAWQEVFESYDFSAVLSCDDSNPYTHLPILLAKSRGIPTTVVHHGALDGQNMLKSPAADVVLAKGEMERRYLIENCRLPDSQVLIGAPLSQVPSMHSSDRNSVVFFSEDYEASGARAEEFYGDILPQLETLAIKCKKKIVVKLHPAENKRERLRFIRKFISPGGMKLVTVVEGELTEELLRRTWVGVTVISSTAVDCARRKIPVFLCGWLENWPFKYSDQYARFAVGVRLQTPGEILEIPTLLGCFTTCDPGAIWESASPGVLLQAFTSTRNCKTAVAM